MVHPILPFAAQNWSHAELAMTLTRVSSICRQDVAGTRYVPLTPIPIGAYRLLVAGKTVGEPACTNTAGEVLYEARYWFDPAVEEAGITGLTWQGLRHTAAFRWVMNGLPIAVVSRCLGHSSVGQTMVYSLLQPDNAARAIAAMMSDNPEPKTDTSSFY
jgi:integrase